MNIRIPAEVHEKLAAVAGKLGTSINSVVKTALTEFTKHALWTFFWKECCRKEVTDGQLHADRFHWFEAEFFEQIDM